MFNKTTSKENQPQIHTRICRGINALVGLMAPSLNIGSLNIGKNAVAEQKQTNSFDNTTESTVCSWNYETIAQEISGSIKYPTFSSPLFTFTTQTSSDKVLANVAICWNKIRSLAPEDQLKLFKEISKSAAEEDLSLLGGEVILANKAREQVLNSLIRNIHLSGLSYEEFAQQYKGGDEKIVEIITRSISKSKKANAEFNLQEIKKGSERVSSHLHAFLVNASAFNGTNPYEILKKDPSFEDSLKQAFFKHVTEDEVNSLLKDQLVKGGESQKQERAFYKVMRSAERALPLVNTLTTSSLEEDIKSLRNITANNNLLNILAVIDAEGNRKLR